MNIKELFNINSVISLSMVMQKRIENVEEEEKLP